MLRITLVFILKSFSFFAAIACYNETHINKSGKITERSDPLSGFYDSPDITSAKEFIAKYDLNNLTDYNVDIQSDIAVNLAYLGKYNEALTILRRLQKANPQDYNVAANLGTTYELTGKNDSALLFIKKSIVINPKSHNGSEWVHVKILEAKLYLAKDNHWLLNNSVLQTGVTLMSPISKALTEKAWDIEYQLQERVPFTPFPDAILASVFNELGDLYATQLSIKHAYVAYEFALQYGGDDQYNIQQKKEELKPLLRKEKIAIPSWRTYYHSRKLENDVKNVVETGSIVLDNTKGIVSDIYNIYKENEREKQRIKERNNLLISAAAFLIAIIVLIIWMKRKK